MHSYERKYNAGGNGGGGGREMGKMAGPVDRPLKMHPRVGKG